MTTKHSKKTKTVKVDKKAPLISDSKKKAIVSASKVLATAGLVAVVLHRPSTEMYTRGVGKFIQGVHNLQRFSGKSKLHAVGTIAAGTATIYGGSKLIKKIKNKI